MLERLSSDSVRAQQAKTASAAKAELFVKFKFEHKDVACVFVSLACPI